MPSYAGKDNTGRVNPILLVFLAGMLLLHGTPTLGQKHTAPSQTPHTEIEKDGGEDAFRGEYRDIPAPLREILLRFSRSWKIEEAKHTAACFTPHRLYLHHPALSRKGGYFSREQLTPILDNHFRNVTVTSFRYKKLHYQDYSRGRAAAEIEYRFQRKGESTEESTLIIFLKKEDEGWYIHKLQLLGKPVKR